jgi:hypothetical protein
MHALKEHVVRELLFVISYRLVQKIYRFTLTKNFKTYVTFNNPKNTRSNILKRKRQNTALPSVMMF